MTRAERLRDDLIRRSVQTGDIAQWSYSPELAAALEAVAQDSADARALEFWGVCHFTGEDWRVHLLREQPSNEAPDAQDGEASP